ANSANDVGSVNAHELTQAHAPTLDNALQGKVAGVEITANSGAPGGGMQIRMRGVTSIYGNSQPLYVVDGLPVANTITTNGLNAITQGGGDDQDNSVNRIADLNPNDIENIEVLKGPSAAAIYGSSAANGVVVITTKRGQVGRPRFAFTQQFGTHTMENTLGLRKFSLADATAFAAPYGISADTVQAWFNQSGGFNDYEKEVYGDRSLSYSSNLSVSGGSENTRYFLSGLAMHDNGIQYNTGYDKQSVRANLTQLVGSKLQIQVNTNLIHTLTKRGISNNDNVNVSPYVVFAATPTFFSFEPVNGVYPTNPFLSNSSNPLQTIALLQTPEDLFRFMGSVNAQYTAFTTATQNLKATLDLSIDHYGYQSNLYSPPSLYWEPADGFPGTTLQRNTGETRAPIAVTLAHTYTAPGSSLQATTSAGVRRGYDDINQLTVTTTDLLAGQQNVDRGANVGAGQNRQTVQTLALYGQEDLLLLDQRLFVSGGVIAQRSTNNADVNKFFYYPKAAASYRFTNIGPFTELKLRAAYGETGNEPLYGNKFGSLVGATYVGQNGVQIGGNVADPNLHPEREKEFETGVDLGLLNSRLAVSGTFYQKTNSDLLLQARLAPSTGFGVRVFNGGEIRNRGVEATITGFPLQQKDLSWQMGLTFSKNVGKVMSLPAGLG
ncbi:MAG: TonB-dependent receptor plug domain-containing protein, partial [Gemmatimonadaceae bacterium]